MQGPFEPTTTNYLSGLRTQTARPTVRSVACAALSAALRAPLRLHCLSLLVLVVVVLLLLVPMLLLARRGCATGLDARVASV